MATANFVGVDVDTLIAKALEAKARREAAERDEDALVEALMERLKGDDLLVEGKDGKPRYAGSTGSVTLARRITETFVDAATAMESKLLPPRFLAKIFTISGSKLNALVEGAHITPEQAAGLKTGSKTSEYLQIRPKKA